MAAKDEDSSEVESDEDFSAAKKESLTDPKGQPSTNKNPKEEWKNNFCFLSYGNFLLQRRLVLDGQTAKEVKDNCSPTQSRKAEDKENYGYYADDKGYLQGEIYGELESDDEIGFEGDLAEELNLMPADNVTNNKRTLQNASELEILVVPNARFVREITDGKHK